MQTEPVLLPSDPSQRAMRNEDTHRRLHLHGTGTSASMVRDRLRAMRAEDSMKRPPWENEDGSTNVDGWIAAYAADNNTFWRAEQGHIMNVVDELLDRIEALQGNVEEPT